MREPRIQNHYGVWVDADQPVNGWYNGNQIDWNAVDPGIDPDYEDYVKENPDEDVDYWEPQTELIGDWNVDRKTGQYRPHKSKKNGDGFAAIYTSNDNDFVVVWSRTTRRGNLGSPCIPGQVCAKLTDQRDHRDNRTLQRYYALPEWALRSD